MVILFLLLILFHSLVCLEVQAIGIDPTSSTNPVNRKILGTNTVGGSECYYNDLVLQQCIIDGSNASIYTTDYGAGQWNVTLDAPNPYVKQALLEGGFTSLRFPGGCDTHFWNWKDGIEPDRTEFKFGINEFLELCEDLDVIPVITLSYFASNNSELLELFRYLKAPSGVGDYWGDKRECDYHRTEPYDVIYFEFGNEVYHGDHISHIPEMGVVQPIDYAERFKDLYIRAKEFDDTIQLGVIIEELETYFYEWNSKVLEIIEDDYDFVITHVYPFSIETDPFDDPPPEVFYPHAFACDHQAFESLRELYKLVGEKKIAITEFNGGIVQAGPNLPVPWRHSFGNAMQVSDLILGFLKLPEEVLLAQFWQFSNLYWGAVYTEDDIGSGSEVYKRPNYWIYEIFDHFLYDEMVELEVTDELRYHVNASTDLASKGWIKYDYETVVKSPDDFVTIDEEVVDVSFSLPSLDGVDVYDLGSGMYLMNFSDVDVGHLDFAMVSSTTITVKHPVRYVLTGWIREEELTNGTICLWALPEPFSIDWYYFHWAGCVEGGTTDTDDGFSRFEYQFMPPDWVDEMKLYFLRASEGMEKLIHGKVYLGNVQIEEREPFTDPPKLNIFASRKTGNENEIGLIVLNKDVEESIQLEIGQIEGWEDGYVVEESWSLEEELDFVDEDFEQNLAIDKDLRSDLVVLPHSLLGVKLVKNVVCDESGFIQQGYECVCDEDSGFVSQGDECVCGEGYIQEGEICVEDTDSDIQDDSFATKLGFFFVTILLCFL